jgi:DNA-binding NarL/FixJ family response regulator
MIATQLVVGEETVKTHLRSIYRKLGVNDRAQAIAAAIRQGMFS